VPGGQYTVGAAEGANAGTAEGKAVGATQTDDPNIPASNGQATQAVDPAAA
jgi:hypothetical protein